MKKIKDQKNKIQKFLNNFSKNPIVVYNSKKDKVGAMYKSDIDTAIEYNNNGHDVFFYINYGGTRKNDITKFVACFVDLDAGRNASGKYYTLSQVRSRKKAMLKAIKDFSLTPHIVTETRNGYQVYWLINPTNANATNTRKWNNAQRRLCNYFEKVGADQKTLKANQIFRIPNTYWQKKWEGQSPFAVTYSKFKSANDRYDLNDILDSLSEVSSTITYNKSKNQSFKKASVTKDAPQTTTTINTIPNWVITDTVSTRDINEQHYQVLTECRDFLREVSSDLFYAKKTFSSKHANKLSEKLQDIFNL